MEVEVNFNLQVFASQLMVVKRKLLMLQNFHDFSFSLFEIWPRRWVEKTSEAKKKSFRFFPAIDAEMFARA